MKARALTVLLPLSLLLIAFLACGYVWRVGITLQHNAANRPNPFYREINASAEEGRIRCLYEVWKSPPIVGTPVGVRCRPMADFLQLRPPDFRRSVWEFDAHKLAASKGRTHLSSPVRSGVRRFRVSWLPRSGCEGDDNNAGNQWASPSSQPPPARAARCGRNDFGKFQPEVSTSDLPPLSGRSFWSGPKLVRLPGGL
jgi:hypothetical protein